MARTSSDVNLTFSDAAAPPPYGATLALFISGTDNYSKLRLNSDLDITLGDGNKYRAQIQSVTVGALVDLIANYGAQNIYTWGRMYSPSTLVQQLSPSVGVLDVTQLYTVVMVQFSGPSPSSSTPTV